MNKSIKKYSNSKLSNEYKISLDMRKTLPGILKYIMNRKLMVNFYFDQSSDNDLTKMKTDL